MPLRKIRDFTAGERPCLHPEHTPPGMIVLDPGEYEYECPGCGGKVEFVVPFPATLVSSGSSQEARANWEPPQEDGS